MGFDFVVLCGWIVRFLFNMGGVLGENNDIRIWMNRKYSWRVF